MPSNKRQTLFRFGDSLDRRLRERSQATGESMNRMVSVAVEQYLKRAESRSKRGAQA